jgi:hypothetical protein
MIFGGELVPGGFTADKRDVVHIERPSLYSVDRLHPEVLVVEVIPTRQVRW